MGKIRKSGYKRLVLNATSIAFGIPVLLWKIIPARPGFLTKNSIIVKNMLLILTFLIYGCSEKSAEIRYYPDQDRYRKGEVIKITLDQTNFNFKEITDSIHQNQTSSLVSFLEFRDNDTFKKIMPFTSSGGYIKIKNVLSLSQDSVFVDDGYPMKDLPALLRRHYLNKGENPVYSDSPERAIVEVTLDTNRTGKELKDFLIHLTRTFDKLNRNTSDSLKLKIMFDYFRQIPSPPPPPRPTLSQENE